MQSRPFAKKVIKMTAQGSILEAFGVTVEHFDHQMPLQIHFLRSSNFDANMDLEGALARVWGGCPYKQVAKLEAWRPGPSCQAYEASKLP